MRGIQTCVLGLAWLKRWNSRVFSSSERPRPVSFTAKNRYTCCPVPQSGASVKSCRSPDALDGNHCISVSVSLGGVWIEAPRLTEISRVSSVRVNLMAWNMSTAA